MSSSLNSSLLELLVLIQIQVHFSTVLVLRDGMHSPGMDLEADLMRFLDRPFIQLTNFKQYHLKKHFKDDILAIVYLNVHSFRDVLNALAGDLNRIAQTKIVFICTGLEHMMWDLFQVCWSKKIINAIALIHDTYYSYSPFPEMQLMEHSVQDNREVFPDRLLNLHRYPLRIAIDQCEPRDYFYTNRKGEELIGGYTGHLIATFAEKLNATITTPIVNRAEVFHHTDYDEMLASDGIDIFAGLAFQMLSTKGQSNVAELTGYCLMLPIEPSIPPYLYYPMILTSTPILLMFGMVVVFSFTINCFLSIERRMELSLWKMFLKEDCLRALLGQSFNEYQRPSIKLRVIYFFSCIMGLFFSTWYQATLNMLVTSPPSEPQLSSFDDIQQSRLKILMYRPEFIDVSRATDEFEKYIDTFELTDNNAWYHAKRDTLDRKYAYPVPIYKWSNLKEQQSLYKAPIFRHTDLCFIRISLMVFLLNENSIYTKDLNQMIVRTHQSGLFEFWVRKSFLELVESGRIKLKLESGDEGPKPLTLEDVTWLSGLFGVLIAIDCVAFIAEVVFKKASHVTAIDV